MLPLQVNAKAVSKLTVEYSGDGGTTWQTVRVSAGKAIFATPAGKSVSLRSTVTDASGNTTIQTVISAYVLR